MFGGAVFQGEAKAGKSWLQDGHGGMQGNAREPRSLVSPPERPGVERSLICVGPDAQSKRGETEHRSRSKGARKRNGRVFRLRDKLESEAVGVRQFRGAGASHEGEA